MELPSPELVERLGSLGLCTPRDFRRSAAQVRRLAQDLPPFDDIWIDALVQQRVLTRFQGDLLSAPEQQPLAIGPFLLEDRVGTIVGGTEFRGRHRQTRAFAQIVLFDSDPRSGTEQLERMQESIHHSSGLSHPALSLPTAANEDQGRGAVVANWIEGERLSDLLVRRGRFPIDVVTEIARQLAAGLAVLERAGGLHGDLRLRNVRLTRHGQAVVVNVGLRPALRPYISLHDRLPPDAYENVSPELIRIGATATIASDLYAFGCLLWQLLAGRPPFSMGDPLAMLAAHQSRKIDDVRDWVPDTPAALATLIAMMTQRDPALRPAGFVEVAEKLQQPQRRGVRRLMKFARAFESAAPIQRTQQETGGGWHRPRLVAAGGLLAVLCCVMFHQGIRSSLARITNDLWSHRAEGSLIAESTGDAPAVNGSHAILSGVSSEGVSLNSTTATGVDHGKTAMRTAERNTIDDPLNRNRQNGSVGVGANGHESNPSDTEKLFALPEVEDGVILLQHRGPFAAAERSTVGTLTLRAAAGVQPVIVVRNEPLKLWGTQVILDHVIVHRQGVASRSKVPMIEVLSQSFGMLESQLTDLALAGSGDDTSRIGAASLDLPADAPPCIRWQLLDPVGAERGRIGWSRSVVRCDGAALECVSLPETIQLQGVLKTGSGALIALPQFRNGGTSSSTNGVVAVTLRHCTLRESRGVLQVQPVDRLSSTGDIRISAEDSLFDPAAGYGLVSVASSDVGERTADVRRLLRSIRFTGTESFLQENSPLAVLESEGSTHPAGSGGSLLEDQLIVPGGENARSGSMGTPVPVDLPHIEGLKYAKLRFRGPAIGPPADSLLLLPAEPGGEGNPPGIDPKAFLHQRE